MSQPQLPRRCSRLYRILPQGAGTAEIEGLPGYIARVARAHLVTPYALLHRCLVWWESDQAQRVGEWARPKGMPRLLAGINARVVSPRWIELLESLGQVEGLGECSVNAWSDLFPTRRLAKKAHAWCQQCYQEAKDPYDMLIWDLQPVRACLRHRCRLVDRCPCCHRSFPALHARSIPGRCPHCRRSTITSPLPPQPADELDLGLAELAGEFLVATATERIAGSVIRSSVVDALKACMEAADIKDAGALARVLNLSRITTWYWLQGRAVPDFEHTLRICYAFQISVANFFAQRVPQYLEPRDLSSLALRPARRRARAFDEILVTKQIETFCRSRAAEPPTLEEVGRAVGFPSRTLREHFPVMSREISGVRRRWEAEQLTARREERRKILRFAVEQCRQSKKKATMVTAKRLLPKPGLLRSAEVRREFGQILMESLLGSNSPVPANPPGNKPGGSDV